MLDHQRLADEVRSFVRGGDQTFREPLRQLAADYAAACREVNDRLRRCEDFLRQGLRSEAVHFAQAEPPLLDCLAALDFPELPRWTEASLAYGLPAPPPLLSDTAEALNAAYAAEQALAPLLRTHRRLALARAPLGERLGVLRQLEEADRGSPVWQDEVLSLEAARLRQLAAEVETVVAGRDAEALEKLARELHVTPWREPPPANLVIRVDEAARESSLHHAREQLRRVEAQLREAQANRDQVTALTLRDRWCVLATRAGLAADDPATRRTVPALRWLEKLENEREREMASQSAYEELERAIAHGEPADELDRLYYDAAENGRKVPPELERRYVERVTELRKADKRRELIIVAVVFTVGMVALVSFILFLFLRSR